jgi:hypothetical protein
MSKPEMSFVLSVTNTEQCSMTELRQEYYVLKES